MHIQKIRVEGFRLLQDVEIMLESASTVIVGRNNSGKTSLTDVFDRFTSENGNRFRLQDFSVEERLKFCAGKQLREQGESPEKVLQSLPKIALTLTFEYAKDAPELGPLAPFIIDLDADCITAIARVEYAATLPKLQKLLDTPPVEKGWIPRNIFFVVSKNLYLRPTAFRSPRLIRPMQAINAILTGQPLSRL